MKKCILMLGLNFLFLLSVLGQNNQGTSTNENAEKKTVQENAEKKTAQENAEQKSAQQDQKDSDNDDAKRKNFFLGVGVIGDVYVNDNGAHDFGVWKKPTLAGNVFVGKWFNQYLGSRIVLEGGKLNPYFKKMAWKETESYVLGRLDLLFDLTNCFRSYDPDRFYNLMPYIGIGGEYAFNATRRPDGADHSSSFLFGAGLWNTFRLSEKFSAYLNLGIDFVNANADGYKKVKKFNGIAAGSIGVIYNF